MLRTLTRFAIVVNSFLYFLNYLYIFHKFYLGFLARFSRTGLVYWLLSLFT